jgi:hypothetical protein
VTRNARDVPGLALAALDPSAPDGVRAYADPPEIADSVDRGEVVGRRTDRVTYVFEQSGTYRLPDAVQIWWDLDDGAVRTAEAPGAEVVVRAGEAVTAETLDVGDSHRSWLAIVGATLVLLASGALGYRYRAAAIVRWRRWREVRRDGEAAAFRRLRRACRTGDAVTTYRLLHAWFSRLPGRPGLGPRAPVCRRADLASHYTKLEKTLFAPHGGAWTVADGHALARALTACRNARRTAGRIRPSILPALNPILNSVGVDGRRDL